MIPEIDTFIAPTISIAQTAGQKIVEIYRKSSDLSVGVKLDGSPLTEADKVSHEIIVEALSRLAKPFPVVSEESTAIPFAERIEWDQYWLVDPLDGTKEFIHRTGEFTVNIALIDGHRVVLGVVYAPLSGELYYACRGRGAFKRSADGVDQSIKITPWLGGKVRVLASRRHGREELIPYLKHFEEYEINYAGSSLKFCRIAEGAADIYPRLGTTSEWDTAAAQCVLEEAGGSVIDFYGHVLQYNTRDSLQNPYFIALGDKNINWLQYFKVEEIYKR